MHLSHMHFSDWFTIAMLVFTVGAPVFFLILSFIRHHLDNPQCSKYGVFTTDPSSEQLPHMPDVCHPASLHKRSWWNSVNLGWVWISLGIAALWVLLMLGAFFISQSHPGFHRMAPV